MAVSALIVGPCSASADQVLDIMARLPTENGTTIVMVTHDPLASSHATRVLHLDKGVLVEAGTGAHA